MEPSTQRLSRKALPARVDVILVVATDVERLAMLRHLAPLPQHGAIALVHVDAETYYVGRCGAFDAALLMCEMGSGKPGASTLAVADAISEWKPRAVLTPGIAFGRSSERQRVGDVLIAEQISPYELQRVGEASTIYRAPTAREHRTP